MRPSDAMDSRLDSKDCFVAVVFSQKLELSTAKKKVKILYAKNQCYGFFFQMTVAHFSTC